ncbi:divergent polysaccharide deacetylase family protein [Thalassobaculum sp. OXR-137]|uniref:divergent polysaccharide deacetylase family protein n=1 Tax=Thalassobaculum sp. OXR-137 TaxID=3100173 RepID=UPI002AC8AEB8|nr:divergent polysaccharide deacetylase family protein [Thalassobaculum sp. OXR-137]WPZ32866.1 divergent polysaccharide deacetylase family protein [Thalassobaculum sp. OXR-137]
MAAQRKKPTRSRKQTSPTGGGMLRRAGIAVVAAGILFGGGIAVGAWIAGGGSLPELSASRDLLGTPKGTTPAPAQTATKAPVPVQKPTQTAVQAEPGIPLPKMAKAVEAMKQAEAAPRPAPAPAQVAALPAKPPTADEGDLPAWRRYAVAADMSGGGPFIAIVLDDLGIDVRRSNRAVALPAPVTLAYLPYAEGLDSQTAAARNAGHELLVHIPMQPHGEDADPGPNALDMRLGAIEVLSRLDWDLARFSGYVGINNHMGSLFTESEEGMRLVAEGLRDRGLLFLDSLTSPKSVAASTVASYGVPTTVRDVFLDNTDSPEEVAMRLEQTEKVARKAGTAIAIGHPRDNTLAVLEDWIPKAKAAGFTLVPLTAVLDIRRGMATQQASRP